MGQGGEHEREREEVSLVEADKARTSLIVSKAHRPSRMARRWLTVTTHQIACEMRSKDLWVRFGLVIVQVAPLIVIAAKAGAETGILAFGAFIAVWFFRMWRDGQSPNLKSFERNAAERAAILYRVVSDLQRRDELGPEQVADYQRDVLRYIAQYVRDHRRDSATPTIFANLLVEEGDELTVVARDRDHRKPNARYPKTGALVAEAISTGEVRLTGDIRDDFPAMAVGKPYLSILVIPVFFRRRVVGAVSIDSSRKYHFDLVSQEIVDHLAPYVSMLGWTIASKMTTYLESNTLRPAEGDGEP